MREFVSRIPADRPRQSGRGPTALLFSILVAAAVAGCSASSATPPVVFVTDSPTAVATTAATATPTPTPTATPAATPTPAPTHTPISAPTLTIGPCNASVLTITIQGTGGVYWQGGTGHELATFVLKNTGTVACTVKAKDQVLLLNSDDSVLILGPAAGTSATLTIPAGGVLHTDVQTGNLCDAPTPVPPVRVAFMMPGGTGLVVAKPLSPTDAGGVPPCLGDPSVYTGSISMQPWAP